MLGKLASMRLRVSASLVAACESAITSLHLACVRFLPSVRADVRAEVVGAAKEVGAVWAQEGPCFCVEL